MNVTLILLSAILILLLIRLVRKRQTPEMFHNKPTLIYFYMNGCPYCDEFDSVWDQFKEAYDGNHDVVSLERGECEQYGIQSFPTVRLYDGNGSYKTFKKERTVEELLSFVD